MGLVESNPGLWVRLDGVGVLNTGSRGGFVKNWVWWIQELRGFPALRLSIPWGGVPWCCVSMGMALQYGARALGMSWARPHEVLNQTPFALSYRYYICFPTAFMARRGVTLLRREESKQL